MTTFSLLCVHETNEDGTVNGTWMQDHIGTLASATKAANDTEAANSNKILVAVVSKVGGACPDYGLKKNLKRLA